MAKIKIHIKDLFDIPTAVIYNPDSYAVSTDVCIDSRKVKKNSIFFAIKGEKLDGHKFIKQAIENGAGAVIINKNRLRYFDDVDLTIIAVKDTTKAYGDLANIVRKKSKFKVISITGSNGKTGTKEILAAILSEKYKVVKTESNNNNHIGVPLTIFSAASNTEILVLEHGTNHFGEIKYTAEIAEPDYAIITNIGNSHLEFLENTEKVYEEKSALFESVSLGGKVFVNNDDKIIKKNTKNFNNKILYGFKNKPDVKGKIVSYDALSYPEISIQYKNRKIQAQVPLLGEVNAKNLLSAVSVAFELKLNKREILTGIKKLSAFNGRLKPVFVNDSMIIDDTYNSNPESVTAAISVLKRVKKYKRKILILGDMFELGKSSVELHKMLSEMIIKNKNIEVFLIGKYMKKLFNEIQEVKTNASYYSSRKSLAKKIKSENFFNTVVLIKGSRGLKMEEFITLTKENMS